MKIDRVNQYHVSLPLKHPFETSFGRVTHEEHILIAVHGEGVTGWGESPVAPDPFYSYETIETCWHIQRDHLIPRLLEAGEVAHATDIPRLFARIRGHNMAKAGIEAALWDLEGKVSGRSVSDLLGGTRDHIESGISLGIQDSMEMLLDRIETMLAEGYARIKMKIKPGWDANAVGKVRERFPAVRLMVDANSAYTLEDVDMLRALDEYDLMMIEQPLAHDDIVDHAVLQRDLETAVCLDESIHTVANAREALALNACRIINIKPARVGGLTHAKRIHDLCAEANVPVWCGGLLETGIGRAHNVALASLPNFSLPGDISASDRYWHEDIVEPAFTLSPEGTMPVPQGPGIGVDVLLKRVEAAAIKRASYP